MNMPQNVILENNVGLVWLKPGTGNWKLAYNLRQNSRSREHFSGQVGQVRIGENDQRLQDGRVLGELGGEAGDDAEDDTDEDTAEGHDQEGRAAQHNIDGQDVFGTHFSERVKQSIQDL